MSWKDKKAKKIDKKTASAKERLYCKHQKSLDSSKEHQDLSSLSLIAKLVVLK